MRKYLTVSEVSKLLNLSAHTIRYYDKEGLIQTKHDDENDYRLFDFDDVYLLSAVIILRECGIPIKDIKSLIKDYTVGEYKNLLKASDDRIDVEMNRLRKLKKTVRDKLNSVKRFESIDKEFNRIKLPHRYFRQIKTSDYKIDYTIKEIYDIYMEKHIDMSGMYNSDIHYILNDDSITLCSLENKSGSSDIISYNAGEYIDYTFKITDDDELFERIEELLGYFYKYNLDYEGDLIMIFGLDGSMMDDKTYITQLQLKIKT